MTHKPDRSSRAATAAYKTLDQSLIRELMHPEHHSVHNQSLAEATVPGGVTTLLHRHRKSEEIYHVSEGAGLMRVDNRWFEVCAGDSVVIPPMTPHQVKNPGQTDLVILCCCSPCYRHDDTELL